MIVPNFMPKAFFYQDLCSGGTMCPPSFVSVDVLFATSKARLDLYYNKLCTLVASQAAKRPKTGFQEIRKCQQNLRMWQKHRPVPNLPSRNLFLALVAKTYINGDIKVFCSCPILPDFRTFCHITCPGMQILSRVRCKRNSAHQFIMFIL